MRGIWWVSFFFAAALAHADQGESPASGLARIEFTQAISVEGIKKLLGYDGNRFYLARADGSVKVFSAGRDRTETVILSARSGKGDAILKRPEAAVATSDTIYVVDSELNRVAMYTLDGKFKSAFGRKGSNEGELRSPRGIAVHDGILYVADSGNARIELFGDNGVFLETLGIDRIPANKAAKDKKLPYLLNKPVMITLDPAGRMIYVLDRDDTLFGGDAAAIKTYAPDGTFLRQFPQKGRFAAISAVADGLYAVDQDGNAIQKFDSNGKLESAFVAKDNGQGQFRSMDGLATGSGEVFLGDSARSVILDFRTNAPAPAVHEPLQTAKTFVRWSATIPATVSKLAWNRKDTLYGIARDRGAIIRIRNGVVEVGPKPRNKDLIPAALAPGAGGLWVLDSNKAQVVRLDPSGNTLFAFGTPGSENGQFRDATDIAVSSTGVIYVADAGNHRVQSFGDDGTFRGSIEHGASGKLKKPEVIAVDPQNHLYILDTERTTVTAYSAKGEPLADFGQNNLDASNNLKEPHSLMATRDEVFVGESDRIRVYSHDGRYLRSFGAAGAGNGELKGVVAIAEKDATSIFVAERGNERIQTFTTIYRPAPPEQLTVQGKPHAIELHWAPSPLPYVAQYQIYRSKNPTSGFVRISASKINLFSDEGLPPDEPYYYRIAAETDAGYEGLPSPAVSGMAQKYSPPRPENIQAMATSVQLKMSWNPLDLRYVSAYLIYRKDGEVYTKVGETVAPEFTMDGLAPGTEYTWYVTARSVDGIESEKAIVQATTAANHRKP